MTSNPERQADEISAISSIFSKEEFQVFSGGTLRFKVSTVLPMGRLEVKYSNVAHAHCPNQMFRRFSVGSLPPCLMQLRLPSGYPSQEPPRFVLVVSWLPPWETSRLCEKLDEIWLNNIGSEILYLWCEFLRLEVLSYLGYEKVLDVSFLYAVHAEPTQELHLVRLSDPRAHCSSIMLHPMHHLVKYDEARENQVFISNIHNCGICTSDFPGAECTRFVGCSHVFCKSCTAEYFFQRISASGELICPAYGCRAAARADLIRELCPGELYASYERRQVARAMNSMKDIIYCPRKTCGLPVVKEFGESLARCPYCGHNFCSFCSKAYHGVAACAYSCVDNEQLIEEYLNANKHCKAKLVKKYGRRMIQAVVEEHLSKEYLKTNTKACPGCKTPVEKTDGCNQMSCPCCFVNFCWLCEQLIANTNPYDHYIDGGRRNKCFSRLFEGIQGAVDAEDQPVIDE